MASESTPAALLKKACIEGDVDAVREILAADEVTQGQVPRISQDELDRCLYEAIHEGHLDILPPLLSHGAKVESSALYAATRRGDKQVFQAFLDHGWDINSLTKGRTALA